MAGNNNTQKLTATQIMLISIAVCVLWGGSWMLEGSMETAWSLLGMYGAGFVLLTTGGLLLDLSTNKGQRQLTKGKETELAKISRKHNEVTNLLYYDYVEQKKGLRSQQREQLRKHFEQKYFTNKADYERERNQYVSQWNATHSQHNNYGRYWKWFIGLGIVIEILACNYTIISASDHDATANSPQQQTGPQRDGETTLWNAQNIPIPYLQDSTRYVSNPDQIISADAEQQVNGYLKKIEREFDIQTVAIIVGRVENADVYRMAQDVGNSYGVGRNDRGLMIVVAYDDHRINISPGRSLEGDLTDAECYRLQQDYVVPCMKAEMPDSAMIYLADALYSTLQHKEMPEIASLKGDGKGEEALAIICLYMLLFGGWAMLIAFLTYRYGWALDRRNGLSDNPFQKVATASSSYIVFGNGGGSSWGGGGFGGGGFGGGSFGGGSFGGGGATSSW